LKLLVLGPGPYYAHHCIPKPARLLRPGPIDSACHLAYEFCFYIFSRFSKNKCPNEKISKLNRYRHLSETVVGPSISGSPAGFAVAKLPFETAVATCCRFQLQLHFFSFFILLCECFNVDQGWLSVYRYHGDKSRVKSLLPLIPFTFPHLLYCNLCLPLLL
jgi:hypothetical protein